MSPRQARLEELKRRFGAIVELDEAGRIDTITLTVNDRHPRAFELLGELPSVSSVDLVGRGIYDSDLEHIGEMRSLRQLRLQGCPAVTDRGIQSLARLERLRLLWLRHTAITRQGLHSIADLTRLTELSLWSAEALTNEDLGALRRLKVLRSVYVQGPNFSEAGLRGLRTIPALKEMYVDGWTIASIPDLSRMTKLRRLGMYHTTISSRNLDRLQRMLPKCNVYQGAVMPARPIWYW